MEKNQNFPILRKGNFKLLKIHNPNFSSSIKKLLGFIYKDLETRIIYSSMFQHP